MRPNFIGRHATASDLAGLDRYEIIGGELVEKASPSGEHGMAQGDLLVALSRYRGSGEDGRIGGWWIGTEIEVELAQHDVYVPDLAGWRIERCPERPRGKPVRVIPDWVCEILSPSTAENDTGRKRASYHRAHVPHYWLVDPGNQVLTVLRWQESDYHAVKVAGPGERVAAEPFDAVEIDVSALLGL